MDFKCHLSIAIGSAAVKKKKNTKKQNIYSDENVPFLIHDLSEQRSCCLPLTEHCSTTTEY